MVTYRDLEEGETLQRGDQYLHKNGQWYPTVIVNSPARTGVNVRRYRRPLRTEGPQSQTQFLRIGTTDYAAPEFTSACLAAVPPTLESDRLRAIVGKEAEHREVIDANTRGRDRAVDLGRELRVLQENFARSFRDRLFIIGDRVVSTDDGRYEARSAEVVRE